MRAAAIGLLIGAVLLGGCVFPLIPTLARPWMIGIERMENDPAPVLPFTNRFLADLAAMPNTQVVYLGKADNAFLFNAWRGNKLRVATWLHGDRACMAITYWVNQLGVQQGVFGLVVPPLPAGIEPDAACVDRAATDFYVALVGQGL